MQHKYKDQLFHCAIKQLRRTTSWLPVAQPLPVDWRVTSGCEVTSGGLGTSSGLTSGHVVTSGALESYFPLRGHFRLWSHFRWTRESLPVVKSLPVHWRVTSGCEPPLLWRHPSTTCQTPIKREWNAEVRTMRFALTEKSCNLIGPFVPRDLYTRRWLATGRSDSYYYWHVTRFAKYCGS